MSEQADLHGKSAPPHRLEHNGKVYLIPHALSVADLLDIQETFYQRAIDSVAKQKHAMDKEDYLAELSALREKYDDGFYSIQNEYTQKLIGTEAGSIEFMRHILQVDDRDELLELAARKGPELRVIIDQVTQATFAKLGPAVEGKDVGKGPARLRRAR
jgi:hypothetical protein